MSRGHSSSPRLQCSIIGCVTDEAARRRIENAIREQGSFEWCANFAELRTRLSHRIGRVDVVILEKTDPLGAAAGVFARELTTNYAGVGIVAYLHTADSESELCALGAAGVHDLI